MTSEILTAPFSSAFTIEFDYGTRTDNQPVYLGTAPVGTSTSATIWFIRFFTYDTGSRITSVTNAVGAWTNRASLTYT